MVTNDSVLSIMHIPKDDSVPVHISDINNDEDASSSAIRPVNTRLSMEASANEGQIVGTISNQSVNSLTGVFCILLDCRFQNRRHARAESFSVRSTSFRQLLCQYTER